MEQMDLIELMTDYGTEEKCREVLVELRWPDGVVCIRCGSLYIRNNYTRNQYDCGDCDYQFSVTSGTMLHDTHLPLQKWFLAVYLMIESKKGISALQLKRTLNVAYRTAWYLCHRIRAAMEDAYPIPLRGIVEIDETFVGGKVRGRGRGYKDNKAVVVGGQSSVAARSSSESYRHETGRLSIALSKRSRQTKPKHTLRTTGQPMTVLVTRTRSTSQ